MNPLDRTLRRQLENAVKDAREVAEAAARATIDHLGVGEASAPAYLSSEERELRKRLRIHGHQLGDQRDSKSTNPAVGKQETDRLVEEVAYEHWHRMLFARFLAENNLLMYPDPSEPVAVSIQECDDLAADEKARNGWELAARFATEMLPEIFRTDSPVFQLDLPPEGQQRLERLLVELPGEVFQASDSLGWVYQFWQAKRKDEVNASEVKIGARELPAVTQLFTEDYMVAFLLDNTLGAWWAGKVAAASSRWSSCRSEADCRRLCELPGLAWDYLRFINVAAASSRSLEETRQDAASTWRPAAGTFDGWPKSAKEITVLDPCMGSGHFLVSALPMLVALRGAEEGLSPEAAVDAVLRDNLFGLEIDPRCAQIAAFNLALAAWRFSAVDQPQPGSFNRDPTEPAEKVGQAPYGLRQHPTACTRYREPVPLFQQAPTGSARCGLAFTGALPHPQAGTRSRLNDSEPAAPRLGYRVLPPLNLACTGMGPQATQDEWLALAEQSGQPITVLSRQPIENGLRNLHALFSDAPTLGSLIDPNQLPADMFAADYETLQPYLAAALSAEHRSHHAPRDEHVTRSVTATMDDAVQERAVAAAGMVKAAELLAGQYTLVITNVPYLGRGKQDDTLKKHLEKRYPEGKADLATAFVLRCLEFCELGVEAASCRLSATELSKRQDAASTAGTTALVTPQNWLFLTTYTKLRQSLLKQQTWNLIARLGPGAFETISGHVVNVSLLAISATKSTEGATMAGIDVSAPRGEQPIRAEEKAAMLRGEVPTGIVLIAQDEQRKNPDAMISFRVRTNRGVFSDIALAYQGISTGDNPRATAVFWEVLQMTERWLFFQGPVEVQSNFGGRETILDSRFLDSEVAAAVRGREAWFRDGVAVSQMGRLVATRYTGEYFSNTIPVIVPHAREHLSIVWAFCASGELEHAIRDDNTKLSVDNGYFGKIEFDLAHWQEVAAEKYPNGLPEPESDDPTQWLFHGYPGGRVEAASSRLTPDTRQDAASTLQVAVARLLGYRWPAELDDQMRLSTRARELVHHCDELLPLADHDGLVCIPAVRGEASAADRLLNLLAKAYGSAWSTDTLNRLLKEAGYAGKTLETWLRDGFFAQHCELFHQRPFLWQIWDGLRDAFSILVNYHQLDRKNLETLIYNYLGDWIARQKQDQAARVDGAEERLAAAVALQKKLELIRDGQSPYDIFVRWKPLDQQPIGWEPDLNDGARLNIRPFLSVPDVKARGAGVLRGKPKIKWEKDRGKEPQRSKAEFPWFWGWDGSEDFLGGPAFTSERFNDCHYTIRVKTEARARHFSNRNVELAR